MKRILNYFLQSETARDTMYLLSGTVISNVFGFALMAFITRSLNPIGFGLFVTALAFAQMLADFSELGINPSSLNFVAKSSGKEKLLLIKNSFLLKVFVTGIVSLFVYLLSGPIANIVFKNGDMIPFVQLSAIGGFLLALVAWSQSIFQSEKRFLLSSVLNTSTNVFRFAAVGILLLSGLSSPVGAYGVFQIILGLSVAIFFIAHDLKFLKQDVKISRIKQIFFFGLPIGASFSLGSIYTRLDQILVFNYLGSGEAGIYGLASRLFLVLVFIISAFSSAIAPRFAHMSIAEFKNYFIKSIYACVGLVGLIILSIIISPFFVPLIFGDAFKQSVIPFQILALGTIFFIFSIPLNLVLIFRQQKNTFIFVIGVIAFALTWYLLNNLIPKFGINGAALAMALVNLFQLVSFAIYTLYLKGKKNSETSGKGKFFSKK